MTQILENKAFDEIKVGDTASLTRALRRDMAGGKDVGESP